MNFNIKSLDIKTTIYAVKTGVLVVGIFDNYKLSPESSELYKYNAISSALKSGDIDQKPGSILILRDLMNIEAKRILLINIGNETQDINKSFVIAMNALMQVLSTLNTDNAIFIFPFKQIYGKNLTKTIRTIVMASHNHNYCLDILQNKQRTEKKTSIQHITLILPNDVITLAYQKLTEALALENGLKLTKDLSNLPSNICTPLYLAHAAKKLAAEFQLNIDILDKQELEILKMNCFLSIANGSQQPPKFIILQYLKSQAEEAPIILVGKGITFDSGGISLKPSTHMDEMKYDMCGAAAVLGTLRAIAELKIKLNVIGVIPACENMPSSSAVKPGDIITSMSGQTIEILNTDAEGRLILCDALTYVERFKPAIVIDIATLTGACVVALGHYNSGLFTREDQAHNLLAADLLEAGNMAEDHAWRLPIQDVYKKSLNSNFADLANIGGRSAGSITAACFLEHFTRKYLWAHLDIAGTAWKSGNKKSASGRPVPLLVQYLLNQAHKKL